MKKVGFIGCGKMAQAMIGGMLEANLLYPEQVMASAKTDITVKTVKNKYGIVVTKVNQDVASFANILVLAVKPNLYPDVIEEIRSLINEETIIVTIAAGISLQYTEKMFAKKIKVVRAMPNTPSLVGAGMTALCVNEYVTEMDLEVITELLESFGKTEIMEEHLMDAIPAISGSSPAYVYMFIEALVDGGVLQGIPRQKAYKLAAQAVLGAAKMVLDTGLHPGMLKDNVCTPGGATIQAVATLEKNNFRSSVLQAMESCTKKSHELSQE